MSPEATQTHDLSALRIHREPERQGGTRGWLLLAAILVVGAGGAAYVLAGRGLRPKKVEAVTAAVVSEGQATTVLTATGYVEAERKADLSPKITSRITELNVTEGTRVKKGDVIARLDSTDLDAQLAEAKANWVNADAELKRQKNIFDQGLTTQSALDSAIANEAASRARVRYVEALLDYTIIRAPFAGVITAKRAFVGEAVSPFGSSPSGGGSAERSRRSSSSLRSTWAPTSTRRTSRGSAANQPAEITLDAVPDKIYHGRLRQIVPAADRQKATVRVKVAFLDADDASCRICRRAWRSRPNPPPAARRARGCSFRRTRWPRSTGRPASSASWTGARNFTAIPPARRAGPARDQVGAAGRRAAPRGARRRRRAEGRR